MRRLKNDDWLKIQTDYQMGMGIRELERKYDVPSSTINSRQKKEGWNQKAHTKLIALEAEAQEFVQCFAQEQLPIAQQKLNEVLDLSAKVKSFISTAIDVNLQNMHAVMNEPDPLQKIRMTAMMKANMVDLANITTAVKSTEESEKPRTKIVNLIME